MNKRTIFTISKGRGGGILSKALLVLLLFGLFGCGRQDTFQVALEGEAIDFYSVSEQEGDTSQEDDVFKAMEASARDEAANEEQILYVHVCGAVNKAGVYPCKQGDRVFQLIEAAGGFSDNACPEALNQAEVIVDGSRIYVPTVEEWEQTGKQSLTESKGQAGDGKVNINTADAAGLCTLPGIGESKAQAILSYREEKGGFQSIEEIKSVSGIGNGVYSKIKDLIKISD